MDSLKNQHIAIVGGSSGIGFRTAQLAAEQGAHLTIGGQNESRLTEAYEA